MPKKIVVFYMYTFSDKYRLTALSFIGSLNVLKRFYLFLDRGEGMEKERERNISVWFLLARPQLETWPATQASAQLGIEPTTGWFAGQGSINVLMPFSEVSF